MTGLEECLVRVNQLLCRTILLVTLCVVLWVPVLGAADDPPTADNSTPAGVVEALYRSVSFGPGEEPDWDLLASLFFDNSVLAQPARGSQDVELWSLDHFIESFKNDLVTYEMQKTGFWERVAGSSCSNFGRVAHCDVVFEMRTDKDSPQPLGRGLDGIQMVKTGGRWWIVSIATEHERPDRPIPKALITEDGMDSEVGDRARCDKLGFDLSELDEHGLIGPPDGKVAVSYEFCVPKDASVVDEVRTIDPSVAIQASSPGRVGCGPTQVLCIGSTHQPDFREILSRLCALDDITRIERAFFE